MLAAAGWSSHTDEPRIDDETVVRPSQWHRFVQVVSGQRLQSRAPPRSIRPLQTQVVDGIVVTELELVACPEHGTIIEPQQGMHVDDEVRVEVVDIVDNSNNRHNYESPGAETCVIENPACMVGEPTL